MQCVALFHAQSVWKWSSCLKMALYCWCIKFGVERNCKQTSPIVKSPIKPQIYRCRSSFFVPHLYMKYEVYGWKFLELLDYNEVWTEYMSLWPWTVAPKSIDDPLFILNMWFENFLSFFHYNKVWYLSLWLWPFDPKFNKCRSFFVLNICTKYEASKLKKISKESLDRRKDRWTKWFLCSFVGSALMIL